jgi:hypothetical protein
MHNNQARGLEPPAAYNVIGITSLRQRRTADLNGQVGEVWSTCNEVIFR